MNVNSTPVVRMCGLISSTELEFINIYTQYAIHCNLKQVSIVCDDFNSDVLKLVTNRRMHIMQDLFNELS